MSDEFDSEDEEEVCDYTGDTCDGDKNFCEDCPVYLELDDDEV